MNKQSLSPRQLCQSVLDRPHNPRHWRQWSTRLPVWGQTCRVLGHGGPDPSLRVSPLTAPRPTQRSIPQSCAERLHCLRGSRYESRDLAHGATERAETALISWVRCF